MDLASDFNEFSFIGRAALISNQKASGRLQDLANVEALGE